MTLQLTDFTPRMRTISSGRELPKDLPERFRTMLENAESLISKDFKGVTADGKAASGLFPIGKTGVPTDGIRSAASAFLESLDPMQRDVAMFSVDSDVWRRWSNIHPYLMRHGALLDGLDSSQRKLALNLLRASLSPEGFKTARDIMKLNESILEITGRDDEYGEWLYWLSIMGAPELDAPWGWQIDGHHLIVNCFVLGDQLVMTPTFMGSEPVAVNMGKYAGTRVFKAEEDAGIALAKTLTAEQKRKAVISEDLPGEVFTSAFRDNFEMKYEGIRCDELASDQQGILMDLIGTYINRTEAGHAKVRMDEIKANLANTYLAWMGGTNEDSVFYYRVHSPVVLIEFDHQRGVALEHDEPTRNHIHTVVRTPNGNDYGKDLLRQHREQVVHTHD